MLDLELDNSGDLLISNYDLDILSGVDQIAQNALIRLKFFLGEWFLDITAGMPYYQDFFIKAPNRIRVESVIKEEIINTDGILEITAFSSDFDAVSREFTVNFSALAVDGPFNLEVTIP